MNFQSRRGFMSWSVAGIAAATLSQPAESSVQASIVLYWGPGPIELGMGATHIQLRPASYGALNVINPRYVLMLTGLSARHSPGVPYDIYLTHGDAPPAKLPLSQHAGRLDFGGGDTRFDVTTILRQWPPDTENLTLSIIPTGPPDPYAAPRIGALAIVV